MPNSGLAPAVVGGGTRTRSQVAPHCQSAAADRGRSRFSPVGDMGAGSYDCVDARIGAITLDALTIATQNSAVSLRLTFRYSGESIFAAATNAPATGPTTTTTSARRRASRPRSMGRIREDARNPTWTYKPRHLGPHDRTPQIGHPPAPAASARPDAIWATPTHTTSEYLPRSKKECQHEWSSVFDHRT
jgi:hypothetical protein